MWYNRIVDLGVMRMDIQLWREILSPYVLAVDEIVVKFNHMINEYKDIGRYCPIEQVEGRMPTFVIKVNNVKYLHFSYMRYIENQIKEAFDFNMVPILVYYKDITSKERK